MRILHFGLLIGLVLLVLIALGIPHGGEETWFPWLSPGKEQERSQWLLLTEWRLPRVAMAVVAGSALSVSGLLLQTLFNNPLAGPSILGLTSGAHLFVAITVLGAGFLTGPLLDIGITTSAALGSLVFGLLILLLANRVRSQVSLLLIGMMLGTFVSALTGILLSKSDPNALKAFTLWSFGSLQQVDFDQLPVILFVTAIGIVTALMIVKPLDALVLGERQATVLGVNMRRTQWWILIIVSVLTGMVTAFCGPIAFVGLIVPNLVKIFYKTANHRKLLIGSALVGGMFLVLCDLLIVILEPVIVLPINSLTSILGAPVVVLLLLKKVRNA
jgi:iron complex transport system permease protein